MKFIKQSKLLTFHIILFSFFYIQNSFSKDLDKWNDGPYVGLSLVFNSIKEKDANYFNPGIGNTVNYNSDREKSKGIKIGYNKMLTDSIFLGPEFFYSGEKSLDFNDSNQGDVTDNVRFKRNYNVGLKAGYAVSNQIAYIIGYGKSYQRVETSHVNGAGADADHQIDNLSGKYRNYGIMFNLGSGYNLEFLIQRNSFDSNINKAGVDSRIAHDIKIKDVETNSLTISKFF
jgi:hypothetical protein